MHAVFSLDPTVAELSPGLGFMALTAIVNNSTGQWFECNGAQIAPYTGNVSIPLPSGTQAPRIITRTPAGFTSTPVAGERGSVTFTDVPLPPSGGTALARPADTAIIVTIGAQAAGVPLAMVVPAGGQPGDTLVIFAEGRNALGVAIPTPTPPPGWTTVIASGQANGGGTEALTAACIVAPFGTPLPPIGWASTTNTNGRVLIVRNIALPATGSAASGNPNPAAVLAMAGAPGATVRGIAFYAAFVSGLGATSLTNWTPAITQDVIDSQAPGSEQMQLGHLLLTAAGNSPSETANWSGAGFSVQARGIAVTFAHI